MLFLQRVSGPSLLCPPPSTGKAATPLPCSRRSTRTHALPHSCGLSCSTTSTSTSSSVCTPMHRQSCTPCLNGASAAANGPHVNGAASSFPATKARRARVRCAGLFNFNLGGGKGDDKDKEKEPKEDKKEEIDEAAAAAALADILRAAMGQDSDEPRPDEVERSEMVNEEVVYFIFQMDLDVQLQRALNYEAYELAQGVRAKRQRVDEALDAMMQRKVENVGSEAASATMDSGSIAAEGLGLRTQLQRAVEEERYADAAKIRDMLAELETRAKRAEALASEFKPQSDGIQFRLGQRVKHRKYGYRGVVVGWDAQCCESEEWAEAAGVNQLPKGTKQPFYQLLVDMRDWSLDDALPPVAYAAEELLWAPELGGPEGMPSDAPEEQAVAAPSSSEKGPQPGEPMSWVERFGDGAFKHPYEYMLFLGQDARGDCLPCKQLRDRYNVQRRDVYAPGQDGTEEDEDEDEDGEPTGFSPD